MKSLHLTLLGLIALVVTACGGGIVNKPAINGVKTIAIVGVTSNQIFVDSKTGKKYSTPGLRSALAMAKEGSIKAKPKEIMVLEEAVKSLTAEAPAILQEELDRVTGCSVMSPAEVAKSSAFKEFVVAERDIWNVYGQQASLVVADGMAFVPLIALFQGDNEKKSNDLLKGLATSLGVDAVAIVHITYKYHFRKRTFGSNVAVPITEVQLRMINSKGETAANGRTKYRSTQEADVTAHFLSGFTFDASPKDLYLDTLRNAMQDIRARINKELK